MNIENKVYVAQAIPVSDSYLPQAQYCPTPASAPELTNPGAREFLSSKKWPIGLQETFIRNLSLIPIRFFICDDSGSMMASDGHRLMQTASGQQRYVQCTRWEELTDALRFHANLAHEAGAPTEFRLLNGHKSIRVGTTDAQENRNLSELLSSFDKSPGGRTPLCKHIHEITEKIARMKTQLLNAGQKACVIIATDGESSDGDIVAAMQRLRTLPVWVVVRLCTDEDRIVNYWNNIDAQLELDMDVLDDLCGEAAEVAANNPWLTYGEPLHRLREFGVLIKEIDMMDSDKLSLDQIRKLCTVIFGGTVDSYPHPELDFNGFLTALNRQNQLASKVWDPVSHRLHSWIRRGPLYRMHPIYICTVS